MPPGNMSSFTNGRRAENFFRLDSDVEPRAFTKRDAELVFDSVIRNREHLRPFMQWLTVDYSLDSARDFISHSRQAIAAKEGLPLGIFRDNDLIGSAGFVNFEWQTRRAEIGYWIDKNEEGKGIVSQACRLLLEYAFGDLRLNRVEIRCSTLNKRSAAVPTRLGFQLEGVLRQSEWRDGQLHDFAVYGLLANEWRGRPRNL